MVGFESDFFTQLTEAKQQFCDALADVSCLVVFFFFSAQTSLNKAAAFPGG